MRINIMLSLTSCSVMLSNITRWCANTMNLTSAFSVSILTYSLTGPSYNMSVHSQWRIPWPAPATTWQFPVSDVFLDRSQPQHDSSQSVTYSLTGPSQNMTVPSQWALMSLSTHTSFLWRVLPHNRLTTILTQPTETTQKYKVHKNTKKNKPDTNKLVLVKKNTQNRQKLNLNINQQELLLCAFICMCAYHCGLYWTVFARSRDSAVPAEGDGDL